MKKITIYHGSINIVEKPIYNFGNRENDFGEGFYCTEDIELAKEWAVKFNINGYVNKYELDLNNLRILDLLNDKYELFNWLAILVKNRNFRQKNSLNRNVKLFLKKYDINLNDFDIVIGYRCDDSFFRYTKDFLNNKITVNQLKEALYLGELGKQIVIKSKKAFDKIKFIDECEVLKDEYYLKFFSRDIKAKKAYEKLFDRKVDINDEYIMDVLRREK